MEESYTAHGPSNPQPSLVHSFVYGFNRLLSLPQTRRFTGSKRATPAAPYDSSTLRAGDHDMVQVEYFWYNRHGIQKKKATQRILYAGKTEKNRSTTPSNFDPAKASSTEKYKKSELNRPNSQSAHMIKRRGKSANQTWLEQQAHNALSGPSDTGPPKGTKRVKTSTWRTALPYPLFCHTSAMSGEHAVDGPAPSPPDTGQMRSTPDADFFDRVDRDRLRTLIDAQFAVSVRFNDFGACDNFLQLVRCDFGARINDVNRPKQFNFLKLKVVWSQFLTNEDIKRDMFSALSAFELLLLRAFLVRFGHLRSNQRLPAKAAELGALARVNRDYQCERVMLATVLKLVFKRLMHAFSKNQDQPYHSDMRTVKLDRGENAEFYAHYFGGLTDASRSLQDFYICEEVLQDSTRMVRYIRWMGQSEPMRAAVFKFCSPGFRADMLGEFDPRSRSIAGSALLRRHKYYVADRINKRLNNYEIVLNQFDTVHDRQRVLRWMGVILKDLSLNPRLIVPCTIFQLERAVQLFMEYFTKM